MQNLFKIECLEIIRLVESKFPKFQNCTTCYRFVSHLGKTAYVIMNRVNWHQIIMHTIKL